MSFFSSYFPCFDLLLFDYSLLIVAPQIMSQSQAVCYLTDSAFFPSSQTNITTFITIRSLYFFEEVIKKVFPL